jgi:glucose/arabinose dehydrogenase
MTVVAEHEPSQSPLIALPRPHLKGRTVVVLLILLTGLGWLAKGRGFRYAIMQKIHPAKVAARPIKVALCRPADGALSVALDAPISMELTRGVLDPASVNDKSVTLIRTSDQTVVAASIELTGPRKLMLHPATALEPGTNYTVYVGEGLQDNVGSKVVPYAIGFTTAAKVDPAIRFQKVAMDATSGVGFTALVFGPDHMLYGGSDDGRIFRFPIGADGVLGSPMIINSLQASQGGPRLLIGLCFDPASTIEQPILWASHGFYGFEGAPDWSGKISRVSGRNLQRCEEVVINLPRSIRDHLTNQPAFGPDGALYFPQGSNSAFGAADHDWGDRPERLLSASILRLDTTRVTPGKPLDARTRDGGGTYDPNRPGALLTIYAGGVRLAYDLLWADDGNLYAPVNGSSAGGNTPESSSVRGINNVLISEDDWLFRITKDKYYGHPNPQQGHFILNGGNPTGGYDFGEVPQYPAGTAPDPAWTPAVFDFGKHVSANGIIQYKSDTFGGKLKRKLLVCRYNVPGDLAVLELCADGTVKANTTRIAGITGLSNPLDLVEDPTSGSIYVSEYGARRITMLRPVSDAANTEAMAK